MTYRHPSAVARRVVAATTSGFILAGLLLPAATLAASNASPVARADYINTLKNVATSGNVLANDKNPGGGSISVASSAGVSPTIGVLTIGTNGAYTFTPTLNWAGTATTTYVVTNGNKTKTGTIYITVRATNVAPVANADVVTVVEDTPTDVTATLLANDTDADGDVLWVTEVSGAVGGSVDLSTELVTFTPAENLCAPATAGFDYTITDGFLTTSTAHVTVDVTCVNDAPVATDDGASGTEDMDVLIDAATLATNDTDADNDTLTVTDVSNPANGSVVLESGTITFTPGSGVCGPDAAGFDYTVDDGNLGTATGHVSVSLTCVNKLPVTADDGANGIEDTDVVIDAATLASNDTDADNDTLTVTEVSGATGGSVALLDGTITFTPAADRCGLASAGFDYTVDDGNTGTATGHVTIDLDCVNDAPVAVADFATVLGNSGAAGYHVIANDTDVDGDDLSLVDASVDAASGSVAVNGNDVTFTPKAAFAGEALITYHVGDGLLTATGTLTVTVGADVTAPVVTRPSAQFATGRVDETAPLKISWSATDASSGVASYEVQVSIAGGAFKPVYAGTATSVVKFYSFKKTLVWRVRATDVAGNTSAWVSSVKRSITAVQNSNALNVYRGGWTSVISLPSSGRGYTYATRKGASNTVTFTGRAILYVAPKNAKSGYVKVYVDGALIGRFNLRRSTTALGRIIAKATWSTSGRHTIRVVNDQGGKRTNFDAFIILR